MPARRRAALQRAYRGAALTRALHSGAQKNSTFASMEGYTLEGTKKTGMSVKTQRNVLAAAKKAALEQSTSGAKAAAPAKKK